MTGIVAESAIVVLNILYNMMFFLVIASAVVSWVNADPYNPIVRIINNTTEPMYRPFRRFTSRFNSSGLDLAPLLFLLTMIFVFEVTIKMLQRFAV